MTPPIEVIEEYLSSNAAARTWAYDPEHLDQEIQMPVGTWTSYFAQVPKTEAAGRAVDRALDLAAERSEVVAPNDLAELTGEQDTSGDAVIVAWVTTMCWGAGPRNLSRLRQWHRALARPDLAERLRNVRDLARTGDLEAAHRTAWLPGCGESFYTKWLWASGLPVSTQLVVQPLVYDARVQSTLAKLGYSPPGRNRSQRWVAYCSDLGTWADELNTREPGRSATPATLEHLLFARSTDSGATLHQWLDERS